MSYSIQKLTALPARAISSFSRASGDDIQCEGWLFKKRRRKHQGYARRYFVLRASGELAYSLHPHLTPREQFSLRTATISSNAPKREIHIDCQNGVYHVKATSAHDFEMWMAAFRQFITVAVEETIGKRFSVSKGRNMPAAMKMTDLNKILDDLSVTIANLEDVSGVLQGTDQSASNSGKKKDISKDKESLKSLFRIASSSSSTAKGKIEIPNNPPVQSLRDNLVQLRLQFQQLCDILVHATEPQQLSSPTSPLEPPTNGHLRAASMSTLLSVGDDAWHDALEFPEEVVITEEQTTPRPSHIELEPSHAESMDSFTSVDTPDDSPFEDEESSSEPALAQPQTEQSGEVIRRSSLPAPISGDEVSLFSLLRKNIGKDLSTISFPVTSNEPLGLLQRLAEDLEYSDLLTQAVASKDPTERMCIVAAFAVSGFACTRLRSGRKPFTPMIGETFEEKRMKFIAEKVSNRPLIIAGHAEGDGWEWSTTNAGKNHFWGKSLEIEQTGTTRLRIGDDLFEWNRPSCFIRNLVVGTKYLEHVGTMTIENKKAGMKCVIEFKEAGYWGTPNVVSGTILSSKGDVVTRLEGTWHEQLSQVLSASHLRVLWRANPFPKHAPQYYGFTSFATTLNEITPDIAGKLPPTDTRYRPDLRALEEGNIPVAESEKIRVETAQRERRSRGAEVKPRWFKQVGSEDYIYTGGYWEERVKGWSDVPALW